MKKRKNGRLKDKLSSAFFMKLGCYAKLLIALGFLLGLSAGYCTAAVYVSKENPQFAVQYSEVPPPGLASVSDCKTYSEQFSGQIWKCHSTFTTHYYWNGEIVDKRMDEIAKTAWLNMLEQQKQVQPQNKEPWTATILGPALFILMWVVIGIFYLLPSFIAFGKDHPQKWSIAAVNLCLGETGLGWVGALVWAFQGPGKTKKPDGKSKICPQCNEKNNLAFKQCWKCGASFVAGTGRTGTSGSARASSENEENNINEWVCTECGVVCHDHEVVCWQCKTAKPSSVESASSKEPTPPGKEHACADGINDKRILNRKIKESVNALVSLGYNKKKAKEAIQKVLKTVSGNPSVEEIVRAALKH